MGMPVTTCASAYWNHSSYIKFASHLPETAELLWSNLELTMVQATIFAVSAEKCQQEVHQTMSGSLNKRLEQAQLEVSFLDVIR